MTVVAGQGRAGGGAREEAGTGTGAGYRELVSRSAGAVRTMLAVVYVNIQHR